MKRILCSDWLSERARWASSSRSGFHGLVPQEKFSFWPYNHSLIGRASCDKTVECWPRYFLHFYRPRLRLSQYDSRRIFIRFWKLPTYSSPKPTLSLTSQQVFYVLLFSLKAKCCPKGGVGGQFPSDV